MMLFGALEAGGTKMVCAVGDSEGNILDRISIPTEKPEVTIPKVIDYFKLKQIAALGIGSFGPVDLDKASASYGHILNTPKLDWVNYDLLGSIKNELKVPIGLDTDVNCACLGEMTYGCARGLNSVVYITVGTGVGVGVSIGGELVHGMLHPEAGHILLRPHPKDSYAGKCPYHQTCFEGLAAGPAINERWGKKADELADCAEVWELEAYYIAQAIMTYILVYSPRKIILGGGVMHQEQLFPLIRANTEQFLKQYIATAELKHMEDYIVPADLLDNQGILGCIELARREIICLDK